ncbi:MAG: tetratricopeptide repeat protein [Candidatus Riflebacteria bacterium]|nr:tetratricopeptide repeat protein [Candidatus Riflebacteria bacterium]
MREARAALESDPRLAPDADLLTTAPHRDSRLVQQLARELSPDCDRAYRALLTTGPVHVRAVLKAGEHFLARGQGALALLSYLAGRRLEPDGEPHHLELARAYRLCGESGKAEEELRAAVTERPWDEAAAVALVELLCDQKRGAEAVRLTGDLLGQLPDSKNLVESLAGAMVRRGLKAEARSAFDRWARQQTARSAALARLGLFLEREVGDRAAAEQAYREALNQPGSPIHEYHAVTAASFFLRAGKPGDAASVCRSGLERSPTSPLLLECLGRALFAQGRTDEAVRAFEKEAGGYTTPSPAGSWASWRLGDCWFARGELARALAAYRAAGDSRAPTVRSQLRLGRLARDQGHLPTAEAAYRRAIVANGRLAEAWAGLRDVLASGKRVSEAIAAHRTVIELSLDSDGERAGLARYLGSVGRSSDAEKVLRERLVLPACPAAPGVWPRYAELIRWLRAKGRAAETASVAIRALQDRPDDLTVCLNAAAALREAGQAGEAGRHLATLLERQPQAAVVRWELVRCLVAAGDRERAERLCREALAANPRSTAALLMLAGVLESGGNWPRAETVARSILELDDPSGDELEAVGDLFLKRDRLGEAESAFRRALARRSIGAPYRLLLVADRRFAAHDLVPAFALYGELVRGAALPAAQLLRVGDLNAAHGRFAVAEEAYARAGAGGGLVGAAAWARLAQCRLRQGQWNEAREPLLRAVELALAWLDRWRELR